MKATLLSLMMMTILLVYAFYIIIYTSPPPQREVPIRDMSTSLWVDMALPLVIQAIVMYTAVVAVLFLFGERIVRGR
ncbi:MAG: hypothetical protein DRN15_00255 [Thermoprotei archaeon]|nr:MAG: hypothetical protein DRN15_00255 [Thermoprotei archaeon]RLF25327.1 MAG: hypothetical protein DRM97_02265 [Thermoprotei archaeon]